MAASKVNVASEFKRLWTETFKVVDEIPIDRSPNELHPSTFPYCGLRHALELKQEGIPVNRELTLSSAYYFEVGNLLHRLLQNWCSKAKFLNPKSTRLEILGNWECTTCTKKVKLSEYAPCPTCGSTMQYREIGVRMGRIHGSLDKVLKLDNNYIPVDYKSTSSSVIQTYRNSKASLPYSTHRAQVESYGVLFKRNYKKLLKPDAKLLGWMVVYVSRDNPSVYWEPIYHEYTNTEKNEIKKRLETYEHWHHLATRGNLKDLKHLYEDKPCKTYDDYYQKMHNPYSPCPWGIDGKCFKHSMIKEIKEISRGSETR